MQTQSFVHLRAHSEYSLRDGILRIKQTLDRVAQLGMPAISITDHCNLFATVKFYKEALARGIKPIIGADLRLESDDERRPWELTLLVMNLEGYRNLVQLISLAYLEGQFQGDPRITKAWLERHNAGLICLSGASRGEVGQMLMGNTPDRALAAAGWWARIFPGRFYLDIQRTGRPDDEEQVHRAVDLALTANLPVVATNDVRFLNADDYEAHETRTAIHEGMVLTDPRRVRRYSEQQYLRSPAEMQELFSDIPEALENSVQIARRCSMKLTLGEYVLPAYSVPEGFDEAGYLRSVSRTGLEHRLMRLFPGRALDDRANEVYRQRLEIELDIIVAMGFPGYFLIVMDFIKWAKDHSIPVGPGRGSGAGSLVAFALDITDLDPIAYDLLFERFLNPERISMPDFDIDFCMENRDRVIDYVAERYGRDAVSQIVTFGTMAAKAVVKDVARVQGKSYGLSDRLSKMIPFEVGMTLSKALEQESSLREFLQSDGEAQEIWDMAVQLEGIARNCGKHAGGVVISPTRITDFSPIYCDEQGQGLVTHFDKDDVESVGLVKFDFLGLRTLTIIDWAVRMVNRRHQAKSGITLDITSIPLDDTATFTLLQRAETTAVFQLESRGMKELIRRLKPSNFEEIIALVALFRPGPLQSGMVDDFINRKHGREPVAYPHSTYQHVDLKPVLEPTYGIILYQEQVMQIAQVLAGYSLGQADLLRRAMGKKKAEEMAEQRLTFMQGAAARGIDAHLASNIFDLMEKFAGYGFNKSHSAAYALIAYQTAWLKNHYPAEFMAAVMSADLQNTDKIVGFIDECDRMGLRVLPPDLNSGEYLFSVQQEGQIIYGLGAIKGLGEAAIAAIIESRQSDGPFADLFDFCKRVDARKLNRRALEALIRAGAMDRLVQFANDPDRARAVLESQLDASLQVAEQVHANLASGMSDMFGDIQEDLAPQRSSDAQQAIRPWRMRERLQREKETLGLYLTGHPVDAYAEEIKQLIGRRIADVTPDRKNPQWVAGLLLESRVVHTKRGDRLCIITIDDRSARIEATLFPDVVAQSESALITDSVVAVYGQVEQDDFSGGLRIRASKLLPIHELRAQHFQWLSLCVSQGEFGPEQLAVLRDSLSGAVGGTCGVKVRLTTPRYRAEFELGDQWRVELKDDLLAELRYRFGGHAVLLH